MNESKATRYQRLRRRARATGLVCTATTLAMVAFTPLARWLADLAAQLAVGWPTPAAGVVSLIVVVTPMVIAAELAALPAVLYQALSLDGAYRTPETVEDVLGAHGKATLVALPVAILIGAVALAGAALFGAWWWAAAGIVLAFCLAAALRGAPLLLGRMAMLRPLDRPELGRRLVRLAQRAGVEIAAIDEWAIGTSAPTAALVTGIGRQKRVVVSSELARSWSDQEVTVVVAHELAHHVHHDLWRTLALDASLLSGALLVAHFLVASLAPVLGFSWPEDLAALPALALVGGAVWTAATPLRHAQSRRHERRADEFALRITGEAEAFGAAIRRLGARHLAEERPSPLTRWLYHRHPPVAERLALADAYRQLRQPDMNETLHEDVATVQRATPNSF